MNKKPKKDYFSKFGNAFDWPFNVSGRGKLSDPFGDYDGDGVPNMNDCQPRNPKKQDTIPNLFNKWTTGSGTNFSSNTPAQNMANISTYNKLTSPQTQSIPVSKSIGAIQKPNPTFPIRPPVDRFPIRDPIQKPTPPKVENPKKPIREWPITPKPPVITPIRPQPVPKPPIQLPIYKPRPVPSPKPITPIDRRVYPKPINPKPVYYPQSDSTFSGRKAITPVQ